MTEVRLKYLAGINERALPESTPVDHEFRYVDIGAVGRGELVTAPEVVKFGDAPSRARRLVAPGDSIVSTVRTYLRAVCPIGEPADDLVVSTGFAVLTPRSIDPSYFAWWLQSDPFIEDVVARSVGVSYPAINALELGEMPVRVSSLAEQRAIADYLDAETARIDALIAKKQQLIHLLEERRGQLTMSAVDGSDTYKGVFRATEIEWIEELPETWGAPLLKLVAVQGTGHTPSRSRPEWWVRDECVVPWITTGEVAQVRSDQRRVVTETRERISYAGLANSSAEIKPAGTVFLCRTASAGYSGIMGVDMATSQDFATWTCGPMLNNGFLLLCLRAMRPDLLGRLATGSTHKTIYMPEIQALKIPLPSIEEQHLIVDRTNELLDDSFEAETLLRRQVELLVERRQALITAAVTGEFTVPGAG